MRPIWSGSKITGDDTLPAIDQLYINKVPDEFATSTIELRTLLSWNDGRSIFRPGLIQIPTGDRGDKHLQFAEHLQLQRRL